ncbi:MAG: ATP synthase F1 subunit delta [Candidatus Komeilibacteria bacterium]|jgi:F-type H+-transporting ATPase subunit delta|nr:ATP synthase F1 subunit delta [Candidatus Komeilibacteria bacterium]MBT4447269.1 ATP synthase F1 subunit delta [Candidatus Komeilibacteria bacterium]
MKKNQVKILAAALYEASQGKKGKELDIVIANFSNYLAEHHLVSMIPGILTELEKLHFTAEGIVAAELTSSEELAQAEIKKIADLVKTNTKQEVVVKTDTDEDLVGGAVVKYNDKIIDMSIRHQLNNLAKQLSN